MRRFVPLVLAVLLALAAGCSSEPTTKYTVRVESGFGGPVNWTSTVDNGARDGGVLPLTARDSANINLDLAPGQRASVQAARSSPAASGTPPASPTSVSSPSPRS